MLAPLDESLDVASSDPEALGLDSCDARQVSSYRSFHTPRSKNVRLRASFWILPGRRELGIAAVIVAGVGLWLIGDRELEVQEADRRALPTAERVADLAGDVALYNDTGVWEKRRAWGGGVELEYNFEPEAPGQPGVRSLCWVDETVQEARETFNRLVLNTVFDWGLGGDEPVGLVWLDEKDPMGDESRLYRVELEREILGHSISLRRGTRTVYAKIEGDVLTDRDVRFLAQELLAGLASVVVP